MEATNLMLPPGFRFHPTDEELVRHYLCRKCSGMPIPIPIIAEIDLYKYNPWQLPGMALYGEKEWYFFSPRDRKYPNGSRPNRAAGAGYWKATGADKAVGAPKPMAIKKALVFYAGKAPKGEKTNWIMHEYRLAGVDRSVRKKQSLRLDEWVLCRIYNKKGATNTPASPDRKPAAGSRLFRSPQPPPQPITYSPKLEMCTSDMPAPPSLDEFFSFDTAVPLPHLLTDSSCSEHVTSAEFTCDREVQSQLNWAELEQALDIPGGDVDPTAGFMETGDAWDPLQDIFMYLRKPF